MEHPALHEGLLSRIVLRVVNLFPGRPMLSGLLCGLILTAAVGAVELLIPYGLERWHQFSSK